MDAQRMWTHAHWASEQRTLGIVFQKCKTLGGKTNWFWCLTAGVLVKHWKSKWKWELRKEGYFKEREKERERKRGETKACLQGRKTDCRLTVWLMTLVSHCFCHDLNSTPKSPSLSLWSILMYPCIAIWIKHSMYETYDTITHPLENRVITKLHKCLLHLWAYSVFAKNTTGFST